MEKKLGRGFADLTPYVAPEAELAIPIDVTQVDIDYILPNPSQPRDHISQESIAALAKSIATDGVLQPILVRPNGQQYQIVAGERRWRASKQAGLKTIPVVVKQVSDKEAFELALIENIQREDLNPIQKAKGYRTLAEQYGYTQEQVASRVGQERPTVTNYLRLLDLPPDIQEMVSRGTISPGHARALLSLGNATKMMAVVQRIIAEDLSVRSVESLVSKGVTKVKAENPSKVPQVRHLEDTLSEKLGTRVMIKQRKKGGDIIVRYSDNDDFDRLLAVLSGRR